MLALAAVALGAVLQIACAGAPVAPNYRSFHNTTGLNLVGQAAVVGRALRLVPARRDSRGDVWTQAAYPAADGFHASFAFRYTHQGGSRDGSGNPGNDGLFFVVQPLSSALELNVDMPPRSLALFFDGYRNYDRDDVSSSRLEVLLNRRRVVQTDLEPLGIRFRDGKVVQVDVDYDGRRLSIRANGRAVVTCPAVEPAWGGSAFIGFHGMGGDAYADVDILRFRFEPLRPLPLADR